MSNRVTLPLILLMLFSIYFIYEYRNENHPSKPKVRSTSSPKSSREMKRARDEYFFRMLRDPAGNDIPKNIRSKELDFAANIKRMTPLNKISNLQWQEAGPNDVGGRTRALAVDITDPNVVLAGGASGGIWKTTDKGQSWKLKSSTTQILNITSLAQDPRPGNTHNWYYTTGEFDGNSASDQGQKATFSGGGVYKSTDNGETWNLLESTSSPDPTKWDGNFDFASKVIVSPATGSVFVASNAIGIFRSTDGGASFNLVLGGINEHIFSDIAAGQSGKLTAVISRPFQGITPKNNPGIYKSADDGLTWTNITPVSLPNTFQRTVLALAPSNENILYVYSNTGTKSGNKEDVKFYKIDVAAGSSEDRSANLPDFGNNYNDFINTQGNYNMVIAVQPNNENVVVLGASSLFRSMDGFATKPNELRLGLIGGYYPESPWRYPNLHPDIHSFAFEPQNSSAIWCGHDGGLSYTDNISNTSYNKHLPWVDKNNNYNITQYYMITIPDKPGDNRIMGGCQDNGTPFFTFNGTTTSSSTDVGGGDGSYAHFGNNYAYASSQSGFIIRLDYNDNGTPDDSKGWSVVHPKNAQDQLFINPFAVDPNNENVMYYPAGAKLWRNTELNNIPLYEQGTTYGWSELNNVIIPNGYFISTLTISKNPAHKLYFAASSYQEAPKIYRLDNAVVSNGPAADISIPGAAEGAYVHNIAVNPDDANEILVVFSNYNVVGLYHSTNGGQSYTAVEGNLTGTQQKPGPSIRAATILPSNNGTNYFIATSIGVFSTTQFNGGNTNWNQEGTNTLGNVVVNTITSRKSDGKVVAGTHGRGAFVASLSGGTGNAAASVNVQNLSISVRPGETNYSGFTLSNTGSASLIYNLTTSGKNNSPSLSNGIMKVYRAPKKSEITGFSDFSNNKLFQTNDPPKNTAKNPMHINGPDFLILDDGSDLPDTYLGYDNGADFGWANEFELTQNFSMDYFLFYMQTDVAIQNKVYLAVLDGNLQVVSDATLNLPFASLGDWYKITFDNPINFNAGSKFYILIQTKASGIFFPAGMDNYGSVTGKSYYLDGTKLVNLNTTQFENGVFLIRASGTLGGTANQPPNASAQLSKLNAKINETITFDASQSSDPDGQITGYQWNFGDGTSSNDMIASHSYSQAKTYNYVLTVTDDKGAAATSSGQVVISDNTVEKRLTVSPESGTISAGSSVDIFVTYNASGLGEGTYQEQIVINSNGGNITIPVIIVVSNSVDVEKEEGIPRNFFVDQNYPNPFNPSTQIKYGLPAQSHVVLKIYDTNGKEIIELLNEEQPAGTYRAVWNGRNNYGSQVSSGIYLYSIQAGSYMQTKKMIFMK